MADHTPAPRKIDRGALERIIQRAAELQAGDLDTGDELTEQELLKLGQDVGIDSRFLRRAMYEEGAGPRAAEKGLLARWFGPGMLYAGRVVPGTKADIERALELWMTESEAMTVKRRMPDRTVWERQRGFFAEMKRGFGVGGKNYMLAKAHDVSVAVTQLESGFCHVELSADTRDRRGAAAGGSAAGSAGLLLVGGGAMSLVTAAALPLTLIAMVPIAAAVIAPITAAVGYRKFAARIQLALDQLLDRLEHGEIKAKHLDKPLGGLLNIAVEIRNAIEGDPQKRKRLNP